VDLIRQQLDQAGLQEIATKTKEALQQVIEGFSKQSVNEAVSEISTKVDEFKGSYGELAKEFVEVSKLNPLQLGDNDEQIIFTLLSNNTLQLDFIHSDRRNNVFEIEADYVIASEVSSKLGKRRIVLRKGNYSVSFNSDGTASVKITISSN
jgi:hypothetical protein